jgi:predicted Zn-dependent peptidase
MTSPPPPPEVRFAWERHTLDNGLRVVLHRDPSLPLLAVNLWYHVGSKNEQPGKTGFAHLFEHMLFQGSEHVATNEHFRHVQEAGGVANGSTWYDRTNYFETLPSQYLDLGLWLESDRMGFLLAALTQENLDNQREVVMNERRQRVENQPYGRAMERVHELLYPDHHPYHWPVIGYMDDIARATLEDVRTFFRTFYAPNNAVLTLAGDFDPAHARDRVAAWFGDIPSGPPLPPVSFGAESPPGEWRGVIEDDVRLPRLYVGFRTPAYGTTDWYAADLLGTLLGNGKSSPLYRDLVYARQIAQDIGVSVSPLENGGTFLVVATARPGVPLAQLEEAILGHLETCRQGRGEGDDHERARNQTAADYMSALQKLDNRADLLSQNTTYFDDPERINREIHRYWQLTREDLTRFAAQHLGDGRRAVVHVVPRGEAA